MSTVSAYECRFADFPPSVVHALTRGKARYSYLLDVQEFHDSATFADISVRRIGEPVTSERLKRTAAYRGLPDIQAGQQVTVNGNSGVVVDGNDSANFDVLFTSGPWVGCTLNVHPGDMKITRAAAEIQRQRESK